MMLREGVDVVVARHLIVEQGINIREHHFLLVFHVRTYLVRILIVELHDESCQIVVLVERLLQFLADKRQLEVQVILVAGLEVVDECGDGDAIGFVKVPMSVNGEVDEGEERVSVHVLLFAHFAHSLVTKAEVNTEAPQTLENTVVVGDERNHLVIGLVKFLVLHLLDY